ncbi:MAG: TRZ/ATZ family hydrolase [Gammaproteobacteria bacterium]|nr:MAG: TRZ/ATZ family hydrolase [Gammaproteobacteria bacterium]UCH39540.1 MAG: TRZ/ATZ family hydrolase [Gammaproteobacteria bacterium]
MQHRYQIIQADWTVTVNADFEVLHDFSVVVEDNRIQTLIANDQVMELPCYTQAEIISLPGCALMPGLVNSHTHASMSLFRGLADDLPLMQWLTDHIWPAEARWVDAEFTADGFRLAAAEMIRSGTTCLSDMFYCPDEAARCAQQIGMRSVIGLIVLDFPSVWAQNADEYLHKALAVHDEIRELPLVSSAFAPHAPYTVSDEPLRQIAMYSSELDVPVHMHVHETAAEVAEAQQKTGQRPLERLDQLNLLNPNLIAVHMTELDEFEIERVAEAGVNIAHCPESNLKLASGICPVSTLLDRGVNVCLGTDGAASNNDLDLLGEMRTAAMLAKGSSGNASACNARQAIEMATINGARALGMADQIGSIEPGKLADLIALDLTSLNTQPLYDPVAQIAYAASSRQVSHVWIDGVPQLRDFEFCQLDSDEIIATAAGWANKIKS